MTPETLASCTGASLATAGKYAQPITDAMFEFGIIGPAREAAFLAQIGHESGGLKYATELWGPTDAQLRYEWRADLGNTQLGDGSRFRGRGLIQITGRSNYGQVSTALGVDYLTAPELLARPGDASRSAGWFWDSRNLNAYADSGDFVGLTRRINGGTNGLADRQRLWALAKTALTF